MRLRALFYFYIPKGMPKKSGSTLLTGSTGSTQLKGEWVLIKNG